MTTSELPNSATSETVVAPYETGSLFVPYDNVPHPYVL